jgi:hypothetical protein
MRRNVLLSTGTHGFVLCSRVLVAQPHHYVDLVNEVYPRYRLGSRSSHNMRRQCDPEQHYEKRDDQGRRSWWENINESIVRIYETQEGIGHSGGIDGSHLRGTVTLNNAWSVNGLWRA